jgi:hypothetical protein
LEIGQFLIIFVLLNTQKMETKYGDSNSYEYLLDKERLGWLTNKTNRSNGQTQFLFQLVEGDFEKLKKLEVQLKNCFCYYCPGDKQEVENVLNREVKSKYFSL